MKRKAFFLVFLIPLLVVLAYLSMDYIHKYILLPTLYILKIGNVIYEALPQAIWWGIFLIILAVIALGSLLRGHKSSSDRTKVLEEEFYSRARSWTRWFFMSHRGHYSKWLLARHLSDLTIQVLAYQDRQTPEQIRARILDGELDIPSTIWNYLQVGLNTPSFRHYSEFLNKRSWIRLSTRFWITRCISKIPRIGNVFSIERTISPSPLDLDPEIIIQFLETRIPTGGSL